MGRWLRRIRGALGMGLLWGVAWFGAGLAIMLTALVLTGSTGADVPYPVGFGALGFIAGVVFSIVLGIVERNGRFDEISMGRFAGWGAVGGFIFATLFTGTVTLLDDPGFMENLLFLGPIFGAAGAGCAGGALAIARKADDDPLLSAGSDELLTGGRDSDSRA